MRISSINIYTVLIFALLLSACKRDEPTSWDSDVLFPIATANLSLSNLLGDSLISVDEDGIVHFVIEENLTDFDIDSLVKIPDTSIVRSFSPPLSGGPFVLTPGTQIISLEEDNVFNINTASLKEVKVSDGILLYEVRSYIDGQLLIEYNLPGVTIDGQPLEIGGVTLPASDANPYILNGEINLAEYSLDFTGQDGDLFNTMFSSVNIKVDPAAIESANIYGSDSISIELSFIEPKVHYALGFFGHHTYELKDTIAFNTMQNIVAGNLDIGEIDLTMKIDNYVGIDAQIQVSSLGAYNSFQENTVPLDNSDLAEAINITRANDNNGYVSPTFYNIEMNELNSNLDEFVENLPDNLILDIDVEINPLGDISGGNDFIYTDQPLEASIVIDMPLCIHADNLTIIDTLEIASDGFELNANGQLHIYAENGFPFSAQIQLEIINSEGVVLEELFSDNTITSANYSFIDNSTVPISSILNVIIEDGSFENINNKNRFVLHVLFNTLEEELVKFHEDHFLDIKIVADINAELEYN